MKQCLTFFDSFGVPPTLKIQQKQTLFKSHVGGLLSLAIYMTSFLYFSYVFFQWYNDQIPPKMFASRVISDFKHLDLDQQLISVGFVKNNQPRFIDPFQQQNNILIPIMIYQFLNGTTIIESILDDSINATGFQIGRQFDISSGINQFTPTGFISASCSKTFSIIKCDQSYLKGNQTCATEEIIESFFAQENNVLFIQLNLTLLNGDNNPITNTQVYYFGIEQQFTYRLGIDLKTNIYSVDKHLLSSQPYKVEYLTSSTMNGQTNSIEYGINASDGLITYGSIFIMLQAQQTQVTIQYPQMGELLASVGSIISILFVIKYVIYELNSKLLYKHILEEVISFYYPQFSDIKIQYNFLRQMKSASYKGHQLNLEQFKISYRKLIEKSEKKITFNNLFYEISRLYMILRTLRNTAELKQSHSMGIELNSSIQSSPYQSYRESQCKDTSYINQVNLEDHDFDLISLDQRKQQIESINDEPPISSDTIYKI